VAFDADAFVAAREAWSLTIGGRTYPARPVSVQQVLTFQQAIAAAGTDARAYVRAVTVLLRAAFPARWAYLWSPDPVRLVLALDTAAQQAVLTDFFGYLVRTLTGGTTRTTPPSPPSSAPILPPMTEDGAAA
jgi:hypothetical protein